MTLRMLIPEWLFDIVQHVDRPDSLMILLVVPTELHTRKAGSVRFNKGSYFAKVIIVCRQGNDWLIARLEICISISGCS